MLDALRDDLNTPAAIGELFSEINRYDPSAVEPAIAAADLILFDQVVSKALGLDLAAPAAPKAEVPAEITALAEKRWAAKQAKDWPAADALRKEIAAAGWTMLDRKDGYSLEPAKK
jgi:cysteinyl-tRNA synthetase